MIIFNASFKALRTVRFVNLKKFLKVYRQNLWKSQKNDFHIDYVYLKKAEES